jgi:uncharacterized membrane protein YdfJ with MMPL/SSD domain
MLLRMRTQRSTHTDESNLNVAARIGRWSVQHRRKAILGWLAFVFVSLVIGFNLVPQKNLENGEGMPGESGQAAEVTKDAYPDKAGEQVLVQSKTLDVSDPQFKAAIADVTQRLERTKGVDNVATEAISKDGHSALVTFELPGDQKTAEENVVGSLATVDAAAKAHPELRIEESGDASINKATMDKSNKEMGSSLFMSLGLTLIILLFTFGALVAAGIPVLLGLTAVLATLGLLGPVSQLAPVDASVMHVVLLIGMAVGVDYSLFYIKREREERAAGRDSNAAIEAAAATSGRAVVISGFTVMVAMAGMYLGGISNFASFATGTIIVVAVAVLGSLTVLPATLSKLGHRVEKGRVPFLGRFRNRGGEGIWSRILTRVLRRPLVSAIVSAGVLVALTIPVLGIETSLGGTDDTSRDIPEMQTYDRIQAAFPSEGSAEMVVIKADDASSSKVVSGIQALESEAGARTALFEGKPSVDFSPDKTVATVTLPTTGNGTDDLSERAVDALRNDIVPSTVGQIDGVEAYTTGEAAATGDFNDAMIGHLPYVFAFVLSAAFLLLLVTFRSIVIPLKAIVLNMLSVGSAYGLLVLVFQNGIGESLLGLGSGPIAAWLPLFLFVILFGLSMDYHVFILTRIREAFDRGMSTEDAVAHGIKSTAGVVTSAAVVMVAVFSMFATSSELQMQQMGIGLAAAVLIDATIIRGVLLPSAMTLLGDRNWWLPKKLGWLPQVTTEPEVVPAYG